MTIQSTSIEAFRHHPDSLKARILAYLATVDGAADHEIEAALNAPHSAVSGDRRHLVEAGLVEETEQRRRTPRNAKAIVWRLVQRKPQQPEPQPTQETEQLSLLNVPASPMKSVVGSAYEL